MDDLPPTPADPPPPPPGTTFGDVLRAATPRVFVTPALLAANVGLFVVMLAYGVDPTSPRVGDLLRFGANQGLITRGGEWWRLLSCTFVHIGIPHVILNMYVLYQVGPLVERLFGNAGFAVLYLAAGLAGSLASTVANPEVVSAGASGAIFGLFGGLLAFVLRGRRGALPRGVAASLGRYALTFVALNVAFGAAVKGIDHAAHLGGLAGGFVAGLALALPPTPAAVARRGRRAAATFAATLAVVVGAAAWLATDDVEGAMRRFDAVESKAIDAFNEATRRHAGDPGSAEELAASIETEILPPYRRMLGELQGLVRIPAARRGVVERAQAYATAREAAFAARARALRVGTVEARATAEALEEKANLLARGVGSGP